MNILWPLDRSPTGRFRAIGWRVVKPDGTTLCDLSPWIDTGVLAIYSIELATDRAEDMADALNAGGAARERALREAGL